ncbi:phage tail spike protein [Staphylococcus coagulans]|uniref:phage tail spike protein n=1 Tax=Staphylococcus coagulans TaxID=74706 RepID=UPI001BEBC836|nr:phage tail spike protein [Staphylococcus coagulans]MBT2818480.1 hypothetical protein [Staphylococcus coagulans]
MIHVMNFKGEIIDYISRDDNALVKAVHHRNINDRTETFDFTILSERTINMQERNRIIIQDKNGQYREFIIDHISQDIDGYTEIETVASYLEDIAKAKPYAPHKFEKMTTRQALSDVLKDTGWSVSDQTEYGGVHTTSWTSYQTRYEVLLQLCTSYKMMVDFYIEIGSNSVEKRYVMLRKRQPLFNGKEITYGKDLTGLKRTVDYSEVKTALLCVGPEKEGGKRIELIVKDDDAQARIGLPGRYNWGIYEPETEDENMDEKRLRTLGTTELNKRKKEAISYEVTALDIQKAYSHEVVNLGDMVRIKNRDFTPPLYVEAEVISEEYDMIAEDVVYGFGEYVEYREKDLRDEFTKKLDDIRSKLNDSISNINTIVKDSVDGQLEYFERKIIKSASPPEDPVNDMLWLDISNPDVPVLKRYWNGQWIIASVDDVEKIGGITREKALFSELKNTFINLSIQHSKLLKEMYEILSSEYLVDEDLKSEVNTKLDATIEIYNNIKSNLESMTEDTATIGKLIDTQALFLTYRQKLQDLYNSVEKAKLAIEKRFKLLQSQYTDEKFNDAMTEIANVLPNGHWDPDTKQLTSDIPNEARLKEIERVLKENVSELDKTLKNYTDSAVLKTKNELSASVRGLDEKVENLQFGGRNLLLGTGDLLGFVRMVGAKGDRVLVPSETSRTGNMVRVSNIVRTSTSSVIPFNFRDIAPLFGVDLEEYVLSFYLKTNSEQKVNFLAYNTETISITPKLISDKFQRVIIRLRPKALKKDVPHHNGNLYLAGENLTDLWIYDIKLEKGSIPTDWTPAPEDTENAINNVSNSLEPIRIRTTQVESGIKILQDKLLLTATKDDVTRVLDEKLQPIKNDVLQQNANIELLPNKITQQVTQQIYETTISGLVKRLEAEESKRETLANQINDTVSIRQYQAGIQEAKEYADEQLKDVANAPGIREGIAQANEEAQESLRQYINAQDALKQQESQAYVDGQISVEEQRAINEAKQKLAEAKQHAEDKANEAQRLSNSYTDGQIRNANRERDQILTQYDSRISQNGREIALRTTKNEFNATNRTLSRVISEIVQNVTTGATIRFDDNGTAQSLNVGPSGVLINSSKFQINDGDVVVQNGRTTIKDAYIDKLFSKQATINYLKAVDVDLNRATVSGTSNGESTVLSGGKIRSTGSFTRTFPQGNVTYEAYTESWNGVYRSGLISKQFGGRKLTNITRWLSLTDKTVTTQREIHSLSPDKNGARFIDFFADENYNSDVYGQGMHIYSGQQLTIESEYGLYLNANKRFYIRTVDSGLEINKDGQNLILKRTTPYTSTVGSGGSYMAIQSSDGVEQAHVGILSNNRSLSLSSSFGEVLLKGNKVFALDTNGNNRVPMYAQYFSGEKVIGNIEAADTNIYAMCHSELRVVSKAGYNGGNPEYKNIRFNSWNAMSHEKYKYDIQKWDYNVLELFRNDLQLYAYKVNSEAGTDYTRIHHGIVLRENSNLDKFPVEWRNSDGFDGNEVLWWNIKATQELANENEELKKQIDELKEKIDVILEMVK